MNWRALRVWFPGIATWPVIFLGLDDSMSKRSRSRVVIAVLVCGAVVAAAAVASAASHNPSHGSLRAGLKTYARAQEHVRIAPSLVRTFPALRKARTADD